MHCAYLLINLFCVLFPVLLSFDKRVQFYRSWRYLWPGMLITGLLFLVWDVLFTVKGVWSFNGKYIIGLRFFGLPLEEILFFLTVPFACVFIYACLNYYVKWAMPPRLSAGISIALILVSATLLMLYGSRLYTLITFALLLPLLIIIQLVLKAQWLPRFYMAYMVCLIPFYIVNGILTSIPVVIYNNQQNMGLRAGTIPFEDHFYLMSLLLMNVGFFEYFKKKGVPA